MTVLPLCRFSGGVAAYSYIQLKGRSYDRVVVIAPSHYESFGMVALEAMACNTSVIISNVSGGADLINSNRGGLITTVNNPLLLAEQIEDLISVKPGRTVQKKGYNPTKKFTWRKTSLSLAKVYKNA